MPRYLTQTEDKEIDDLLDKHGRKLYEGLNEDWEDFKKELKELIANLMQSVEDDIYASMNED